MRTFALAGATALLLGTAALPSTADAALIISNGGEGCSYDADGAGGAGAPAACTSKAIDPNSAWKSSVGDGAKWISYAETGSQWESNQTPNNATMTITESFVGEGQQLLIKALADDYANIKIYRTDTLAELYSYNTTSFGNQTCNTSPIGCIDANQLTDISSAVALSGIGYTFVMTVFQTNGVSFGVNYSVSSVPLPAAALLFGSALAGLGVMRRRRKDEPVPVAA